MEECTRYRATDFENPALLLGGTVQRADVDGFEGTLLVDEGGTVRRLHYEATAMVAGERHRLVLDHDVSGVEGETRVNPRGGRTAPPRADRRRNFAPDSTGEFKSRMDRSDRDRDPRADANSTTSEEGN